MLCTIKFAPVVVPHIGIGMRADRHGYIHPKDFLLLKGGVMPRIRFN
jgi:hypothetical protein